LETQQPPLSGAVRTSEVDVSALLDKHAEPTLLGIGADFSF